MCPGPRRSPSTTASRQASGRSKDRDIEQGEPSASEKEGAARRGRRRCGSLRTKTTAAAVAGRGQRERELYEAAGRAASATGSSTGPPICGLADPPDG